MSCVNCGTDKESLSATLNRRVSLYGKTKTKNELDQTSYVDELICQVWAQITPQTGNMQRQQVETMLTNVTHKLIVRYRRLIEDAYQQIENKSDMHIMYRGHRFNIRYILNPYFRNKTLEIFVEEVIG